MDLSVVGMHPVRCRDTFTQQALPQGFRILRSYRFARSPSQEAIMKALITSAIVVIVFASPAVSLAAQSEPAMQDCFKKHAQLMAKPAVKNPRDCWRTHGHLMERS